MAGATRRVVRTSTLPHALAPLDDIAANLWWSWNPEAVSLFACADAETFAASNNNPMATLRQLSAERKRQLARDEQFLARLTRVHSDMERYLRSGTWYHSRYGNRVKGVTAYFCMEYGLHESLPLYAGGLGILAGDHLKSARHFL